MGLTPVQLASVRESDRTVNLWTGSVSSGKTVASIMRWMTFLAATEGVEGRLVIAGRTLHSVWRNVILPAMDAYPGCVQGNFGAASVKIFGRHVDVIGASDVQAESKIRGITALGIYMDEVTTLPQGFFEMALTRLRVMYGGRVVSKLFCTTNPDGPSHWLKAKYLDRLETDPELATSWRVFPFRLEDNTALSAEYVELMKRQFSGLFYRRFIAGEWVAAEGAVWPEWSADRHVVSELPEMERWLAVGLDFGSTHKSAAVLLGYADGRLYVAREWSPQDGDEVLAPSAQSESFRAWLGHGPPPEWVYVDSAARAFRDQLSIDGCETAPAWKAVLKGIQTIHSLLVQDRLLVHESCRGLITEIEGYRWDAKATDRGRDQPVKEHDDYVDALRYAVLSSQVAWRPLIDVPVPQGTPGELW